MRFRYAIVHPDGRSFARDLSADTPDEVVALCDQIWREAGLDPLSDDPDIEIRRLPDA